MFLYFALLAPAHFDGQESGEKASGRACTIAPQSLKSSNNWWAVMTKRRSDIHDVRLGRLVRKRRLALGLSQRALASKLGIAYQQVQHYERGTSRVTAGRLQHISQALKVETSYFFGEQRSKRKPSSGILGIVPTVQLTKLMKAFQKIKNAKCRRHLVGLAETWARSRPR
jgi:transcriptional regulator with XRE-family HTH domain